MRLKTFILLLFILFKSSSVAALTFSGNVTRDFSVEACRVGSDGRSLAMPPSFPGNITSGFDVQQICLLYDRPQDILYVGVKTFENSVTGQAIPFGDADGDGDPGRTSNFLLSEGGNDFPDLSLEEHFALILDFDANLNTPPDIVAGISAQRSAPSGFRVAQIIRPHPGIDFSFSDSYYGDVVSTSEGSALFGSPTAQAPHLEFTIRALSRLPGFPLTQRDNPDASFTFIFKAGSLGDVGTGEEDVRLFPTNKEYFDEDGDGIPNVSDPDADNDTLPDTQEGRQNTPPRDTDQDGIPDFLDLDSDNDGLSDQQEKQLGTNPYLKDTDTDGTFDKQEIDEGRDPLNPDAPPVPAPSGPTGSSSAEQLQGSGGCSLIWTK